MKNKLFSTAALSACGGGGLSQVIMAFISWARHVLQWGVQTDAKINFGAISVKASLSSDCFLQFENMKPESLVIVDQRATVNMFYSSVHTARHVLEVGML